MLALRFSTLVGGSAGGLLLVEVDSLVFGDCSGEYEVRFWKAVDEELECERSVMVSIVVKTIWCSPYWAPLE